MKFGLWATFIVFVSFVLMMCGPTPGWFSAEQTKWGYLWNATPNELGDTLAGFAGALAFLWIIVTVMMQSKELALQRQELKLTRQETKRTANALSEQKFDSFFFELVSTHNSIVQSISINDKTGREALDFFVKGLRGMWVKDERPLAESIEKTVSLYEGKYKNNSPQLGHYFRFVYNAMRVLQEQPGFEQKHKRLFRAQFSDDELVLIFYNSLTEIGKKMKPITIEFKLLDNLPEHRLARNDHKDAFFGNNSGEPQ